MSSEPPFAKAVRSMVPNAVPCATPMRDIKLLQILDQSHIRRIIRVFGRNHHVLMDPADPGHRLDTLDSPNKADLRQLLESCEKGIGMKVANRDQWENFRLGISGSLPIKNADVLTVGLELFSHANWKLEFAGNDIMKDTVNRDKLREYLRQNKTKLVQEYDTNFAIITSIYYVKGLTYKGNEKLVSKGGATFNPASWLDVIVGFGCKRFSDGTLEIAESDQEKKYVVAIRYHKLEEILPNTTRNASTPPSNESQGVPVKLGREVISSFEPKIEDF